MEPSRIIYLVKYTAKSRRNRNKIRQECLISDLLNIVLINLAKYANAKTKMVYLFNVIPFSLYTSMVIKKL